MKAMTPLPSSFLISRPDQRVEFALALISRHFKDSKLSVETLAAAVHLSPSHLRRILVQTTKMSPYQLIKHYRLECSKHLLEQTFLSVKEINYMIGLNDVSHFVRDFKVKYGMTPSEYRARVRPHAMRHIPELQQLEASAAMR